MEFELNSGESVEVFDSNLVRTKDHCVVYRVSVSHFNGANLKIISNGRSKMITADTHSPSIDIAVWGNLFLEASGDGSVAGAYEPLLGV